MCLPVKSFKVEREWESSGLKCAVVLNQEHGYRCGYVRVPPEHPYYDKEYIRLDVDVHGGLTFGAIEPCAHEDGTGYWFGFDCNHCNDASYEPGSEPSVLYYDYAHQHYWTFDEVVKETERLASQFASLKNIA